MLGTEHKSNKCALWSKSHFSSATSRAVIVFYGFAVANLVKMVLSGGVDYCYSDIGCFPLSSEFFHPQHRPINLRPWHRDLIKTQFELFNRQHPEGYMLLPWNKLNLMRSGFNPRLETKIIVPGWLDNITRSHWLRKLRDSLLWLWAPVNLIVVRWRNFTPYTMATANTRVVGAELANLLKFIEAELNYDRAYYHIIGHSLGAHVAGYCGDRIYGLGRITALDPARPFFQGMPKSVRLDRSDAKFIDAIHSDFTPENAFFILMSFGMTTPVGHLDFYPNGPPLFQPGCLRDTLTSVQDGIAKGLEHNSLSTAFLESIRYLTACDHQRSHEWFIESISNRECAFVGVRCNEFEGMINGRCTCDDSPSACAIMGIHADQMYMNNVHEELWPVRAGSIDYKYGSTRTPEPIVVPAPQHAATGASPHFSPFFTASASAQPWHSSHPLPLPLAGLAYNDDAAMALAYHQLQAQMAIRPPLMKDEIYAQLKEQASRLQHPTEPSISAIHDAYEASEATTTVSYQDEAPAPLGAVHLNAQASEREQQVAVLDDMAFVDYLKINLLAKKLESLSNAARTELRNLTQAGHVDSSERPELRRRSDGSTGEPHAKIHSDITSEQESRRASVSSRRQPESHDHPDRYNGHPRLVSNLNRDIESWYEDNSKWFLKTNNRPNYCSNQYQLLIFLGPVESRGGRDSLRANLLVSIIGSRGQLLNQRFVPRGSSLNSFTMQPFFILLEGSYSLGQIRSVALAWEARNDPDPVQATIKFQSNLLEAVGSQVPAYQAKNNPWMPESTKYDKTEAFQPHERHSQASLSVVSESSPLVAAATNLLKSNIGGHYSNQYRRIEGQKISALKSFGRRSDHLGQDSPTSECHLPSRANGWRSSRKECRRSHNQLSRPKRHNRSQKRMDLNYALGLADPNQAVDYDEADEVEEEDAGVPLPGEQSAGVADQLLSSGSLLAANLIMSQTRETSHLEPQQQVVRPMDGAAEFEPMFVPLIDPPHPGERIPPAGAAAALADLDQDSNEKLTLDLHNIDLHSDGYNEDSIVVNKVIVSPMQAYYGAHGRNAKTFCPSPHQRRLHQDKTVRLRSALIGKC